MGNNRMPTPPQKQGIINLFRRLKNHEYMALDMMLKSNPLYAITPNEKGASPLEIALLEASQDEKNEAVKLIRAAISVIKSNWPELMAKPIHIKVEDVSATAHQVEEIGKANIEAGQKRDEARNAPLSEPKKGHALTEEDLMRIKEEEEIKKITDEFGIFDERTLDDLANDPAPTAENETGPKQTPEEDEFSFDNIMKEVETLQQEKNRASNDKQPDDPVAEKLPPVRMAVGPDPVAKKLPPVRMAVGPDPVAEKLPPVRMAVGPDPVAKPLPPVRQAVRAEIKTSIPDPAVNQSATKRPQRERGKLEAPSMPEVKAAQNKGATIDSSVRNANTAREIVADQPGQKRRH